MTVRRSIILGTATFLAACGTYYDPTDEYVRGVRFFDRGNYTLAKQLWEPLVKDGDCDAEFRLGLLYFLAYGVKRDVPKAISLWTSAANRGQPRAQYALGDINFHSENDTRLYCRVGCESVEQDLVSAYKWYLLAEKHAHYDNDKRYVAQVLPRIRSKLSSQQKIEGETAAGAWKATPVKCKPRELL